MDQSGIFDQIYLNCSCNSGLQSAYFSCQDKKLCCLECFMDGSVPFAKFYQSLKKIQEIFSPLIEDTFMRLSQTETAIHQIIENLKQNLQKETQISLINKIIECQDFGQKDFDNLMKHLDIKKSADQGSSIVQLELKFMDDKIFEKTDQQIKMINQFYMDNFWNEKIDQKQFDSMAVKQEIQLSGQEILEFNQSLIVSDKDSNSISMINKYNLAKVYEIKFDSAEEIESIVKAPNEQFFLAFFTEKISYFSVNQKKIAQQFSIGIKDEIVATTISEDSMNLFVSQNSEVFVYEIDQTTFKKLDCSIRKEFHKNLPVPIYALYATNQLLYVSNIFTKISIYNITEINQNKIQLKWELKLEQPAMNNFLFLMQNNLILLGNNVACLKFLKITEGEILLVNEQKEKLQECFQNYKAKGNLLVFYSKQEIKLFQIYGTESKFIQSKIFNNENIYGCKFSNCGTKLYVIGIKLYIISLYLQIKQRDSQTC